jgi:hypothetical protein
MARMPILTREPSPAIGADALIGSNSPVVAPMKIGADAYIGSGSVVKDIAAGALAVAQAADGRRPVGPRGSGPPERRESKDRGDSCNFPVAARLLSSSHALREGDALGKCLFGGVYLVACVAADWPVRAIGNPCMRRENPTLAAFSPTTMTSPATTSGSSAWPFRMAARS